MESQKTRPEETYRPHDDILESISDSYQAFYKYKGAREQTFKQIQYYRLEDFWKESRLLFWNTDKTKSEDLAALGLDFSLPFARKEVLDFTGRLVSLNINPSMNGEGLDSYTVKVLQAMYKKWRFKSRDKVEKFWQILYSAMNGTVCSYVGFNTDERTMKYLTEYDRENGTFKTKEHMKKMWNDAFTEIVPLEEIYLKKIWEHDIQKQGRTIRYKEMDIADFKAELGHYQNAKFVEAGSRIAEDSLFFELLGGTQLLTEDKVGVLYDLNTDKDEYKIIANGILLNPLGKKDVQPNPFHHKMQPYTWSLHEPIDEKFAYGMSLPFSVKETIKLSNVSYTMAVERELRAIDPPVLSSDFEAPDLIFGQQRVIPVNDVNAYKEFKIEEASGAYFTMMNSLQGLMSSFAQGGSSQVAPSRQPKSAREVIQLEKLKQQSLGNTLVLFYDLIHQETMLLLKTMLQFYPAGRYETGDNLLRVFTATNMPLTRGNVGNIEVRFVKYPHKALDLYFEAARKSIEAGKPTEIIEMPVDIIDNLEFYIDDIKLEPQDDDEMKKAMFNEQILPQLLNVFIPAGVADINKTYIRWLEKNGEHPSSFTAEQNMPQIMSAWGGKPMQQQAQQPMGGASLNDILQGRMGANQGAQTGNLNQSRRGTMFGSRSNGGFPADSVE